MTMVREQPRSSLSSRQDILGIHATRTWRAGSDTGGVQWASSGRPMPFQPCASHPVVVPAKNSKQETGGPKKHGSRPERQ